ncbi:MAG: tol-pal system protein YbgF [Thermodesulfobacteriota bacterium]|nr:tol-pal system protein YbgF [Thermodesulfobacteriota bacterium]
MVRKTVIFPILLSFMVMAMLLGGCIPSQTQLRMEQDQQEMKRRLAEIERRVLGRSEERAQETDARLETLSRRVAEQQAALDTLRVDLQTINGRLEDMSRENNALRDNMDLIRDDLDLRLSALEDRLMATEEARSTTQPQPEVGVQAESKGTAQDASPEALYEQGRDAILRNGEFARGRETLGKFLQQYPDHELAVNAFYWIGEAYYGEKKYENAILQFQDVIEKYSDHPKSAAAMLKQALAFDALGDRDNALVILRRVGERYPLSEEARKAEEFLDKWS